MSNIKTDQLVLAHGIRTNGLSAVLPGPTLMNLRQQLTDKLPAAWIEFVADTLNLQPTQRVLMQAVDLWMVHRLDDSMVEGRILPLLAEQPAFAKCPDNESALALWRQLFQPLLQHIRHALKTPRPERTTPKKPLNPETLRHILSHHYGKATINALEQARKLRIIEDLSMLPQDLQAQYAHQLNKVAAATMPDGTIYMVANRMSAQQAPGIFLHEVGEHAGMATMLGKDYGRLIQHYRRLLHNGDEYACWAAMRVPMSTPDAHVPSEQLAYLIEKVANDKAAMPGGEAGYALGQECLSAMRAWLFRTPLARWLDEIDALNDFTLRPEDIAALARQSLNAQVADMVPFEAPEATAWIGQLDSQLLDQLYHAPSTERIAVLSSVKPELQAGYLYGLVATGANDLAHTLDAFTPQLAKLADGQHGPHLVPIAGELLEAAQRQHVMLQVAQQLDEHGVAMVTQPGTQGSTLQVFAHQPGSEQLSVSHFRQGAGCFLSVSYALTEASISLGDRAVSVPAGSFADMLAQHNPQTKPNPVQVEPPRIDPASDDDRRLFALDDENLTFVSAETLLQLSKTAQRLPANTNAVTVTFDKPVINRPTDAFLTHAELTAALGTSRANEALLRLESELYDTASWKALSSRLQVAGISEVMADHPSELDALLIPAAVVFTREPMRGWLKEAGFDGAVYASVYAGETWPTWQPFDSNQVQPAPASTRFSLTEVPTVDHGQIAQPAFQKWFNESQVIDPYNMPLLTYCGTTADFNGFEDMPASNLSDGDSGMIWTAQSADTARLLAEYVGEGEKKIVPAYVALKKPLIVKVDEWHQNLGLGHLDNFQTLATGEKVYDIAVIRKEAIRKAKEQDRDGVIFENGYLGVPVQGDVVVAFGSGRLLEAVVVVPEVTVDEQPWYRSALTQTVAQMHSIASKAGMVRTQQAKSWLLSQQSKGSFKKEEADWVGINEWLDTQPEAVSVADIELFVRNKGIRVSEVQYSNAGVEGLEELLVPGDVLVTSASETHWLVSTRVGMKELSKTAYPTVEKAQDLAVRYFNSHISERNAERQKSAHTRARYSEYALPNGTNYKELLLIWDQDLLFKVKSMSRIEMNEWLEINTGYNLLEHEPLSTEQRLRSEVLNAMHERDSLQKPHHVYQSGHWNQQPNVLAHVRLTDREDLNGNKVLFVEEIQSDWAQEGRDRGFKTDYKGKMPEIEVLVMTGHDFVARQSMPEAAAKAWIANRNLVRSDLELPPSSLDDLFTAIYEDGIPKIVRDGADDPDKVARQHKSHVARMINDAGIKHYRNESSRVPSAPFVKNTKSWVGLVIRRLTAYAAEHGYDKVAFVNGEQAASNFGLIYKISSLNVYRAHNDYFSLNAFDISGEPILFNKKLTSETLPAYVGKELAERIIALEPGEHTLDGVDLVTGGEGMKAFYDQIVPQVVADTLKKLGGDRVESVTLNTISLTPSSQPMPQQVGFSITPALQLRASDGLPLFRLQDDQRLFGNSISPMLDSFSDWSLGTHVVNQSGIPKVVFSVEAMRNDLEDTLFASGVGSKRFVDFKTAWDEAERRMDRSTTNSAMPFQITPTYVALRNPLPGAYGQSTTITYAALASALGDTVASEIAMQLGQASNVIATGTDNISMTSPESMVIPVAPMMDNPRWVEAVKAAGFDGAVYAVEEGGALRTEYRAVSPEQLLQGRPMAVITTENAGSGIRFSAEASLEAACLQDSTQHSSAKPLSSRSIPRFSLQSGAPEMALTLTLERIPGLRFDASDSASIKQLNGLATEIKANLIESQSVLQARLAWLNQSPASDQNLIQKTKAKLFDLQSESEQMKRWALPSKHNTLDWDAPVSNGIRKLLSGVISIQADEEITGKQAFWLASATHGSYQRAAHALEKAGIIGVRHEGEAILWNKASYTVAKHAADIEEGARFHLAYHGSPHFFDRFDMSRMGTGEGAQTFGRGIYLTESLQVANHYKHIHNVRCVQYENTVYQTPEELIDDVVPRIIAQHPEFAEQPSEIHQLLGIEPTGNTLEGPLRHYLNILMSNPYHEERVRQQYPLYEDILEHVKGGVCLVNGNSPSFRVMPANGARGLNEIAEMDDGTLRRGLHVIESRLHWFVRKDMDDETLATAFNEYLSEVTNVADATRRLEELANELSEEPDDQFLAGRVDDAEWHLKDVRYAAEFVDQYGPLSIMRPRDPGNLYLLDVDIDESQYLLHDQPFAEQSDMVREVLTRLVADDRLDDHARNTLAELIEKNAPGSELYSATYRSPRHHSVNDELQAEDRVVTILREEGVLGIKYRDGFTRKQDSGHSFNYVVFDSERISIIGHSAENVYDPEHFDPLPRHTTAQPLMKMG